MQTFWLERHLCEAVRSIVPRKDGVTSVGVHISLGGHVIDAPVDGDEKTLQIRVASVVLEEFLSRKVLPVVSFSVSNAHQGGEGWSHSRAVR